MDSLSSGTLLLLGLLFGALLIFLSLIYYKREREHQPIFVTALIVILWLGYLSFFVWQWVGW